MTPYFGDFAEDATVRIPFNTFSSDDPAASVTITNLADADIKVHKDGGLTQIVTDGATVAINYDGITGNHLITIDTSASATYTTGSDYQVRIEGTTVDAGTINAFVGSFSIENRFNDVNVVTVSGTAQTGNDNGADLNTLLTRIVGTLAAGTHNPASTAQLGALTDWLNGGRLDLLLDAIKAKTDPITFTVANEVDVNVKSWFDTAVTALESAVDVAIAVWDRVLTGATHNIINSAGRRLRQIEAAFVVASGTAQAGTANTITLATGASSTNDIYNGDRIIIVDGTGAGEHGLVIDYDGTTKIATMSKNWVITPDNTSEYDIVPADCDVETWNNTAVTGDGDWAELQTDVDSILADTNELQTDDVPGLIAGLNDLSAADVNAQADLALSDIHLDHLLAVDYDAASPPGVGTALLNELLEDDAGVARFTVNALENGPSGSGASAAAIADAVWDEAQADHLTVGSMGESLDDASSGGAGLTQQQVRDAMKLAPSVGAPVAESVDEKLDNVETSTAGLSGAAIPTEAQIYAEFTAGANEDAFKADVSGLATSVEVAAIETDTQDIQSRLPAALLGGRIDSNVGAISEDSGAADNLEASLETMVLGTATGGSTASVISGVTGHGDDTFIGRVLIFRTGTLQYEAGAITDYDSASGTFTFAAATFTTSPTTETFVIV